MATRETKTPATRSSRTRRDSPLPEATEGGGRYATRRAATTGFEASAVDEPAASGHEEIKRNQVVIDGEEYQLAEGDLLLDRDQVDIYALDQRLRRAQSALMNRTEFSDAPVTPGAGTSALVAIAQEGQIVRWAPGVILTFCVLRETFPDQQKYEIAAQNMQLAAQQWMDVCGIEFRYLQEFDTSTSLRPEGVVFPVRHIDASGAFIAAAFFPTDEKSRWRVLIDPSYYGTSFDQVGVLRHELGHTLGFRHEHIRSAAPAVCPDESTSGTVDLTAYDPKSVMHYFCGGVGSRELAITEVDRTGAQLVYGPPLRDFVLLEP
ncbi:matrixin family metalloprotease [Actinoplanes sp. NPDC004185]